MSKHSLDSMSRISYILHFCFAFINFVPRLVLGNLGAAAHALIKVIFCCDCFLRLAIFPINQYQYYYPQRQTINSSLKKQQHTVNEQVSDVVQDTFWQNSVLGNLEVLERIAGSSSPAGHTSQPPAAPGKKLKRRKKKPAWSPHRLSYSDNNGGWFFSLFPF